MSDPKSRDEFLAEIEAWQAEQEAKRKSDPYNILFSPDPLSEEREQELERDIVKAALKSKFPKANLAQIAKYHSIDRQVVEEIAKSLVQANFGYDLEVEEFNQAIKQIKWLEENIEDHGLREWKVQELAWRYKRTPRQLYSCYEKALINQEVLRPLTVEEFRKLHASASLEWLYQGWLPRGTTCLLHADGGVGKTLFTYQMMEALLKGQPWNGYQVRKGKCLLVQTDEPALVLSERLDIRDIPDDADLRILTNWQVEGLPRLAKYLEEEKPDLVIIDSLTTINKSCIFSENDTEYARPLLHLRDLANEHGCTFLIIHHSNADGRARGSRAIHNSVSEVWNLRRGEGLTERNLVIEKTRLGRPPGTYKFLFDDYDFTFTYLGESLNGDDEGEQLIEEKIRLWMADRAGIPFESQEISEELQISRATARKRLYELWAKGLCKRKKVAGNRAYSYWVAPAPTAPPPTDKPTSCDPSDPSDPTYPTCGSLPETLAPQGVDPRSGISDPGILNTVAAKVEIPGSLGSLQHSNPDTASDSGSDPSKNPSGSLGSLGSHDSVVIEEDEVWVHYAEFDTVVRVIKQWPNKSRIYVPGMGYRTVDNSLLSPAREVS